ncbi:hypothetical protein SEVIR_4G006350v4 [Setaria viridis]
MGRASSSLKVVCCGACAVTTARGRSSLS